MKANVWTILMVLSGTQVGAGRLSTRRTSGVREDVGIYAALDGEVRELSFSNRKCKVLPICYQSCHFGRVALVP